MELSKCIEGRRSIRKYLDLEVPKEKIGKVIWAAASAPSSGNLQNWRFIIVKDAAKRKQIADACLQQYWMETAPVHIVVCGIEESARQYYGMRGERLYTIQNCAASIQNLILTAHDLGLGTCWVGAFDEDRIKRIVGIPDVARPQAVITLGIPDEAPPETRKIPINHLAFVEAYYNKIEDLDAVLEFDGITVRRTIKKGVDELSKNVNRKVGEMKKDDQSILNKFKKAFKKEKE